MTQNTSVKTEQVPVYIVEGLLGLATVAIAHIDQSELELPGRLGRKSGDLGDYRSELGFGGDHLGKIACWLWESDQKSVLWMFLSDLLAQYRNHNHYFEHQESRVTLNQLLDNRLKSWLTVGLESAEIDQLIHEAHIGIPGFYGEDPNSP